MLVACEAYLHVDPEAIGLDLADLGRFTFRRASDLTPERLRGATILVRIEEGSIRSWVTLSVALNVLLGYGALRTSVDYFVEDGRTLAQQINQQIEERLGHSRVRRREARTGVPGKLQSLFTAVDRGVMSADEAVTRALDVLTRACQPGDFAELPRLATRIREELGAIDRSEAPIQERRPKSESGSRDTVALPTRRRRVLVYQRPGEDELTIEVA